MLFKTVAVMANTCSSRYASHVGLVHGDQCSRGGSLL